VEKSLSVVSVVILVAAISGCATSMKQVERQVGAHQPLAYKQGYKDGCDSGYVAAGHPYYKFAKDVTRYGKDELYKQGWDDGFRVCKGEYESIGRALH